MNSIDVIFMARKDYARWRYLDIKLWSVPLIQIYAKELFRLCDEESTRKTLRMMEERKVTVKHLDRAGYEIDGFPFDDAGGVFVE